MKKTICLVLAFIAILIIACNNPKKAVIENPYVGVWVQIASKRVTPDTTIERTQIANPGVKLLTKKHYAFGRQTGENTIFGGGGEYSYHDSIFTSYPKYHSNSAGVGASLRWKSTIKGDLWTISYDTLNIKGSETWKRIPE